MLGNYYWFVFVSLGGSQTSASILPIPSIQLEEEVTIDKMCAHLLLSEHVSVCILNIALSFKYICMLCACVHACSLLEYTQVCVCVFW